EFADFATSAGLTLPRRWTVTFHMDGPSTNALWTWENRLEKVTTAGSAENGPPLTAGGGSRPGWPASSARRPVRRARPTRGAASRHRRAGRGPAPPPAPRRRRWRRRAPGGWAGPRC